MKCEIKIGVPAKNVGRILPQQFRERAAMLSPSVPCFDVLIFGHGANDVAHSSAVSKGLSRLEASGCKVLAVARNFTAEALLLLEQRGAVILRLNDYPWSDARHEEIKIWGGAYVKRPAL